MIARTRVARLLAAWRNVPAADIEAVALVLVQLGRLAADLPQVRSLDINPLLADADGVLALDARIALATGAAALARPGANFAIRPYPSAWERSIITQGGLRTLLRPIRPEDEALYPAFVARVSADDLHARFMGSVALDDHAFLARLTQLDYARAMAFAAIAPQGTPDEGALQGVMRLHSDGEGKVAEFALLVRSDRKGMGLGTALMRHGLDWARAEGLARVAGSVLANNAPMLRLCHELGFRRVPGEDSGVAEIVLDLAG